MILRIFIKYRYYLSVRSTNIVFSTVKNKLIWIIIALNHQWYFFTKIVLTYFEKKMFSDWEKLLKFEA